MCDAKWYVDTDSCDVYDNANVVQNGTTSVLQMMARESGPLKGESTARHDERMSYTLRSKNTYDKRA